VYILRWYWWRINAWSEIAAMIASFVTFTFFGGALGLVLFKLGLVGSANALTPGFVRNAGGNSDAVVLLVTVFGTTIVWLAATFLTKPEPTPVLEAFYKRVRPGGLGWRRISEPLGYGAEQIPGGRLAWLNWLAGVVAVYATLFGIGKIVFGEWGSGLLLLAIAAAAFVWIARALRHADTAAGVILEAKGT
jgi:Na+/proline symporter